MAPPEKKQKTEEEKAQEPTADEAEKKAEGEKAAEEKKVPEPPKEHEGDAPACSKPKVKEAMTFLTEDTTLNVLQSVGTNVLMSMSEGGIQHFLAGARANIGITKGRYMFEVKIVQVVNTSELQAQQSPEHVRIGFSTAGSDLILGESADGICFESGGNHLFNKEKSRGAGIFGRGDIVAVLLNLDKDSPNFNTVSLFKNGSRACQPVALPESLKGKALLPHVSYKHASVHVNFGPNPMQPLPFKCRMVKDATAADVTVSKSQEPADGKYEVVFPVSMPDEGTFDWLDMFLEKNKNYVELSDRKILAWAEKSGIWKNKGYAAKSCNDKPDMKFEVRELDDGSMTRAITMIAPLQKRHYIVMEVQGNLLKEDRQALVSRFGAAHFKKVAQVMVGEPNLEFKKRSQQLMLSDKQAISDKAFALKKLEEKRKREFEKRQKAMAKVKKQEEKKRKKALAAAQKAAAEKAKAVAAAAAAKAAAAAAAEKKDDEKQGEEAKKKEEEEAKKKEEEKKEEEKEEESEESEEEPEEKEKEDTEKPPKAESTAEEKALNFRSLETKDLSPLAFSASFTKFSLPDSDEGFDDIRYEWHKTPKKAKDFLTEWKLDRKLSTRVEDLVPSQWFGTQWKQWQSTLQRWNSKLTEYKAAQNKKAAIKAQKDAKKAKALAEKEAKEKKAQEEKEKAEKEGKTEEKKEEEKKEEPVEIEEDKEEEEVVVDFDALDVFGLDDVNDVGGGLPLCRDFGHEDWTMLALRFELHLLAHAFRRDVNDAERPGIHIDHLGFYYQKYYKRNLMFKDYGVESFKELFELVGDTLHVTEKNVVVSQLDDEMENAQIFLKLTEEARRHRVLRIDLGEEKAALKITLGSDWTWKQGKQNQQQQQQQGGWKQGGGGGGGWRAPGQQQPQQDWQYAAKAPGFQGQSQGKGPYSKGGGKGSEGGGWQDRNQGKGGYGKWRGGGGKY